MQLKVLDPGVFKLLGSGGKARIGRAVVFEQRILGKQRGVVAEVFDRDR